MTHYKFVSWEVQPFENVLDNNLPKALLAADNGNIKPLKDMHIATQNPVYKCAGWAIPYKEYLKRYWVKTKYYGIIEMFSLCKTDIRKELRQYRTEIVCNRTQCVIK